MKIFRNQHELLLGELHGWLEVLDVKNATITHSKRIFMLGHIHILDILAIDQTQFLLRSGIGLYKVTKE